MEKSIIVFTGGGSGGHVVPALTVIESLKNNKNIIINYIGSENGIERELVTHEKIKYFAIKTGKLRRYFSVENLTDLVLLFIGLIQSILFFARLPTSNVIVVSMGGFVAVPVVFAARIMGVNIIIHEQTSRVGLANKLCGFVAKKILLSFEKSRQYFAARKVNVVGYPLRSSVFLPMSEQIIVAGINISEKIRNRPLLLATGGGNGSAVINNIIKKNFHWLSERYIIVHQVGRNFIQEYSELKNDWYFPVPFLGEEIIEIMKASKVIISRAGAGTVCELMALRKVSIFVPLKIAQKNEQFFNAMEANEKLRSFVIVEDDVEKTDWTSTIIAVENSNQGDFETKLLGKNPRELIHQEILHMLGLNERI